MTALHPEPTYGTGTNEAYIKLLKFAHDKDGRANDPKLDGETRAALQQCPAEIVRFAGLSRPS